MKAIRHILFLAAVLACGLMAISHGLADDLAVGAVLALIIVSGLLRRSSEALQVTLSVGELLLEVMDAFRLELFPIKMFTTDFSADAAVMNDTIMGHIATIPTTNSVSPTTGFANGATAAENLLVDVPVVMNQLRHCPVVVKFLSQAISRMPLYKEATRNTGFALAKYVIDYTLQQVLAANFTYKETVDPMNFNLDSLELIRGDLNKQGTKTTGRFGIINTAYATSLQNDDRVKSALFYAMLNGDKGYRTWQNISGFERIVEYPDMPNNGESLGGFFGDNRAVVFATRSITYANSAALLGVPQVMDFVPITDPETELSMTGVGWQQPGTGDSYFSPCVLFGVAAGKQGGAQDSATDKGGLRLTSA